MESIKPINFLQNPHIDGKSLDYVKPVNIYANLFRIKLSKELKIYQYPFEVKPEIGSGALIRRNLFRKPYRELKAKYGVFFIDGDSLYSLKKVEEIQNVKSTLRMKKKENEYIIEIKKYQNEKIIKEEDIKKDPLSKHFIELIIKDILLANPNVERFKDTYIIKDKGKKIDINKNSSFNFYPGYRISFVETDGGNYLNVVLTHKFIRNETILDYFNKFGKINNKEVQEDINAELIGRSFKVEYAKKNYRIDEILFDRSPATQTFNYEGKTLNLIQYYEKVYQIKIKNKDQPLILVRKKDAQGNPLNLYFVPELCNLVGIDEDDIVNNKFMKEVSQYTKMEPDEKVAKINDFMNLLLNKDEDNSTPEKWSSLKKYEYYGINIIPPKEKDLFSAYYMKKTELIDGKNKPVSQNNRDKVNLVKQFDMVNWLFFYANQYYDDADILNKNLQKASGKYNIKIGNPKWVEMFNDAKVDQWISKANMYFKKEKREYDFVLFLLGKNNYIYPKLKIHSLCTNGYVSQVVTTDTLTKKGIMSVCSKILLQINAKLGGAMYKLRMEKSIAGKKIMLVGVDSSKHKDKNNYGTGVAMVATINDTFTDFYNDVKIINKAKPKKHSEDDTDEQIEKDKEEQERLNKKYEDDFHLSISKFIEEAVEVYKKNNKGNKPDWIIIYRQGVSLQQKQFLNNEIREIDNVCLNKNIQYYYILVNTKSTFKFFHPENDVYYNPYSGLLVLEGIINPNYFEFYIQPQEVTQGSATPTCFHVAYGNLNFPEFIPKFTYDLCHLYSNWEGYVRMPNVIKCAEKLSKMTAKYKLNELNEKVRNGQAYL